ncbi:alpha-amylase family glycosyl hydrolase [Niabella sp. 22666]|uniref:alpha-amylase family glycosyl hydrolase n=1 Tax=Niabella sp. 22666 TaxID=3453954 RepID=UPI003F844C03
MMNRLVLMMVLLCWTGWVQAQSVAVYPTHWWTGMQWNQLQLMVRGDKVAATVPMVKMKPEGMQLAPGVHLKQIKRVANSNYIFFDLEIAGNAQPGWITLPFVGKTGLRYELKPRRTGNGTAYAKGVTSEDLMYLIMPDRFSNGDESNDRVKGMRDQSLRRDTVFNRHGGDLKGVQNHLDYLQDLGVTAIWLNPVIENDMPDRTEHGYAFTDHYKIERRIGGEQAYHELVNAAHAKGMKIVQDAVYNHIGTSHFLFKDQPDSSWFHRWPKFTQTSYKDQVVFDPYASAADKKLMSDGWFVSSMPDWDQSNEMVQQFLIQHAIWTVEEFGIDGWRIDTYAYNDLPFMNKCNQALYNDFPKLTIFGETWVHGVPNQSYFCENNYEVPFKSNLQATTDFQTLFYGIQPALTQPFGWTDGVNKLYTTLAQDFLYKDPMRQVVFLDNHDIARFYSVVNEDTARYKTAFAWLLTSRGIPQMYYGNEILMAGTTSPNDGYVRLDFPGGWKGDQHNKFTAAGRTAKENQVFDYIRKLAHFRKSSSAIKTGKLMQFVPYDGVYVYFRYDAQQSVMCIMNTNDKAFTLGLGRFAEKLNGFATGRDVVTDVKIPLKDSIALRPMSNLVLELKP